MTRLAGKKALVTGGSRGIGRGIVDRLAADGAAVFFTYVTHEDQAKDLVVEVESNGGTAFTGQLGIASPDDIRSTFAAAETVLGGLDIVVHNACTDTIRTRIDTATDEQFDYMIGGNLKGGFVVLQEAARRVRDGGRIINISTLDTANASATSGLYAAAKAGVEQLCAIAAKELGPRGITANTVSPGAVDTERLRADRSPEVRRAAAAASPLGRLGTPDDIASVIAFLAGPDGAWITGQNIRAGGGIL